MITVYVLVYHFSQATYIALLGVLNLCYDIYFYSFFFRSQHLQDHQVDIHQIFQEDGQWAAI